MSPLEDAVFKNNVKNKAFELLQPLFEVWGEDRVIEVLHDWYHNKHKDTWTK